MGEAYLMGNGGMRLRSLEIAQQPNKVSYMAGQSADLTGAKIRALFARDAITLTPDNYSYSPSGALAATDEAILITSTIGGVTRTASIPIEVKAISATLNLNDWEMIAEASALGIADEIWNVGDVKEQVINGVTYQLKIVGFNHDELDNTDAQRNNTEYNGNTKKAGITFQFMKAPGSAYLHSSNSWTNWDNCSMRKTTLANLFNGLPSDMKAAIRTVKKYSATGVNNYAAYMSRDKLFLASLKEISTSYYSAAASGENNACSMYEYYQNGNKPPHSSTNNWLRSLHYGCSYGYYHYAVINSSGEPTWATHASYEYYPLFCV